MSTVWDLLDLQVFAAMGDPTDATYDDDPSRYGQVVYGAQALAPWVELNCSVIGVNVTRTSTRDPVLTFRAEPGVLDLTLLDPDGLFDPANQAGPHYGRLRPRLPIRVQLGSAAVATALVDYIRHDPVAGLTQIAATDGVGLLASVVSEVTRAAENSVTRVEALHAIGAAGSPMAPTFAALGTGVALKPATLSGDVWSMMLATAQADRARLTMNGSNKLLYLADWDRSATGPASAALGCPHQVAVDAHAQTWTTITDVELLVNSASASSVGVDGQVDQTRTAADPASIQTFGPSSGAMGVVLPLAPADLQDWVDDAVRIGANPQPRLETLGVTLSGNEATAAADLAIWWALDVADTIRWYGHNDPVGQLLMVTGIRHGISDTGQYSGSLNLGVPLQNVGYNELTSRYDQGAVYA